METNTVLFRWGWGFVKPFSWLLILSSIFPLISGGVQFIEPQYTARVIDCLATLNMKGFYSSIVALVLFQLFSFLISIISKIYTFKLEKNISLYSEKRLFSCMVMKKKPHNSGNMLTLFLQDLGTVSSTFQSTVPFIVTSTIMVVLVSIHLLKLSVVIFVIVILSAIIPTFISRYYGKKLATISKNQKEIQDSYNSFLSESNAGIYCIQDECSKNYFIGRFSRLLNKVFSTLWTFVRLQIFSSSYLNICSVLTTIILLCISCWMIFDGSMTIGGLVSTMMYAGMLSSRIAGIVNNYQNIQVSLVSFERLKNFFTTQQNLPIKTVTGDQVIGIELNHLSFSYDGNKQIFSNLNFFFFFPGLYGVKGKNGTGKSTLLNYIGGRLSPDHIKGEILLHNLSPEDVFQLSSQNTMLFSDSVRQNLSLGHDYDSKILSDTLQMLGLLEIVNELPEGIDTVISAQNPPFSAGQIQRLLVCRAILEGRKIILLDEVDSSMDDESSFELASWLKYMKEKAIIIIANHHDTYDSMMTQKLFL